MNNMAATAPLPSIIYAPSILLPPEASYDFALQTRAAPHNKSYPRGVSFSEEEKGRNFAEVML
jgi:hypothetical protein